MNENLSLFASSYLLEKFYIQNYNIKQFKTNICFKIRINYRTSKGDEKTRKNLHLGKNSSIIEMLAKKLFWLAPETSTNQKNIEHKLLPAKEFG